MWYEIWGQQLVKHMHNNSRTVVISFSLGGPNWSDGPNSFLFIYYKSDKQKITYSHHALRPIKSIRAHTDGWQPNHYSNAHVFFTFISILFSFIFLIFFFYNYHLLFSAEVVWVFDNNSLPWNSFFNHDWFNHFF